MPNLSDGLSDDLFNALKQRGLLLATAESCTGGMIASTITDKAGSSAIFERGFVTYSNAAKIELLAVPHELLEEHGAVSAEVAAAMAAGALEHSNADIAVSCTGIAGPDGGTDTKPVGLVYIGLVSKSVQSAAFEHYFNGDRNAVRKQTVEAALQHIADAL